MAPTNQTPSPSGSSFSQFLEKNKWLNAEAVTKLQKFLQTNPDQQTDVGKFLLTEKLIEEERLTQAVAAFFTLPYVDLRKQKIPDDAKNALGPNATHFYHFVPFSLENSTLKVAVNDPMDFKTLQALEFLGQQSNLHIEISIASKSSLAATSDETDSKTIVGREIAEFQRVQATEKKTTNQNSPPSLQVLESAPIVKIVNVILTNAIDAGASDIHIEPIENEIRVRYRIDGILQNALVLPKHVHSAIISRIKILSNLKIDESRLPQDGRFHFENNNRSVDLRVSVLPLIYGEKIVMRIFDKTTSVPTLDNLGLSGDALIWTKDSIKKTHGILLITGPTGSGKSTTLYSILSIVNTNGVNIVTLEDPVEYFIEGVNQSQINPDIGLTFASGLRSILRQDPNIVMVGEIRDKEPAELAVHAALTGHLVFSTLHTNNAIGAMPRLMDMGIEPFLLTAAVNTVAAQRLVRLICSKCAVAEQVSAQVEKDIRIELEKIPKASLKQLDLNNLKTYHGTGCDECGKTGYRGRIGIFEVLVITPEIQSLILNRAPATTITDVAIKNGMITLKQDGIIKSLQGKTTYEEVIRVTSE